MTKNNHLPLPPDVVAARAAFDTLERELVFGLSCSYKFYRNIRETVCPYDETKMLHRSDFTTSRYNVLYRAIDAFYRRFDHTANPPLDLRIPPQILSATIIDWTNKNGVADDISLQLVDEIKLEQELVASFTHESLTALVESAAFVDWLQTRVLDHTISQITSQKNLGVLTAETFEIAAEKLRQSLSSVRNSDTESARPIGEFRVPDESDAQNLIGPGRFLCRQSIAVLTGTSGIGKSTLAIQMAVAFALGLDCFGFEPVGKLKTLVIQAENDDGDIAEMFAGVVAGLGLSETERAEASANVLCVRCNSKVGKEFIQQVVRSGLNKYKPDILLIDPALAFIGGDIKEQKVVGDFLRVQLIPELVRGNCACLLLHHTNKPSAQLPKGNMVNGEAYVESGSAEFRNVARASISLKSCSDGSFFELGVPKRGNRLGWRDDNGLPTDKKFIRHSPNRQLFWIVANECDVQNAQVAVEAKKCDEVSEQVLACITVDGKISQKDLLQKAKTKNISDKKCREAIKVLLDKSKINRTENSRSGARPEIYYIRCRKIQLVGGS